MNRMTRMTLITMTSRMIATTVTTTPGLTPPPVLLDPGSAAAERESNEVKEAAAGFIASNEHQRIATATLVSR